MERDATTDLAEIEALEADLAEIEAELGALERSGTEVAPSEAVVDSAHQA